MIDGGSATWGHRTLYIQLCTDQMQLLLQLLLQLDCSWVLEIDFRCGSPHDAAAMATAMATATAAATAAQSTSCSAFALLTARLHTHTHVSLRVCVCVMSALTKVLLLHSYLSPCPFAAICWGNCRCCCCWKSVGLTASTGEGSTAAWILKRQRRKTSFRYPVNKKLTSQGVFSFRLIKMRKV